MKWPKDFTKFDLQKNTILLGYMGSIVHGTHIPPKDGGIDDRDVMGICIPTEEFYLGLRKFEQIDTWVEDYDIIIYEFRKFINLLIKNNPNVLGLLWLPENYYIKIEAAGRMLIEQRDLFSSKQAYKSFSGYAYGQLKRMTNYKYEGYMGEKRKALIEQFGYDTKNAAHLIRLLRMGIEFLSTGELNVYRHDAKQLVAIKCGEYTLDEIKKMAEEMFPLMEKALVQSKLKDKVDINVIEELSVTILKDHLNFN